MRLRRVCSDRLASRDDAERLALGPDSRLLHSPCDRHRRHHHLLHCFENPQTTATESIQIEDNYHDHQSVIGKDDTRGGNVDGEIVRIVSFWIGIYGGVHCGNEEGRRLEASRSEEGIGETGAARTPAFT